MWGRVQYKCWPCSMQMCAPFNTNVGPVQYNVCPVQYKCWSRSSWTAQYLSVTVTVRDTGNMQKWEWVEKQKQILFRMRDPKFVGAWALFGRTVWTFLNLALLKCSSTDWPPQSFNHYCIASADIASQTLVVSVVCMAWVQWQWVKLITGSNFFHSHNIMPLRTNVNTVFYVAIMPHRSPA